MRVLFVFDGDDLSVFPSLDEAEGWLEASDIASYALYGDDGTVFSAAAEGRRVRLTPTDECRPEDLRLRLRSFLASPRVGLDPELAGDPVAAAQVIFDHDWELRPFRWFPWLDRRLNGSGPPRVT